MVMKQLNIPFKIGTHYELWEIDLEVTQDRLQGCDSYIYLGKKFNNFLNYPTHTTELIFNFDILEIIVITFKNRDSIFNKLCSAINLRLKCNSKTTVKTNLIVSRFIAKSYEVLCVKINSNIFVIVTTSSISEDVIKALCQR